MLPELTALPDTGLVPVVPAEPLLLPVEAPCAGNELADAGGLVEAAWLGLVEADRVGVVFALGVVLAPGVWPAQLVAWLVGALVPLVLAVDGAVALAVADRVADVVDVVDVAPPVAFAVLAGLPVVLLFPVAGLVGEPDDVGDGVAGGVVGVVAGLGEPDFAVGEGDADDSGHDEIGVGRWCLAAVVWDPAVAWP